MQVYRVSGGQHLTTPKYVPYASNAVDKLITGYDKFVERMDKNNEYNYKLQKEQDNKDAILAAQEKSKLLSDPSIKKNLDAEVNSRDNSITDDFEKQKAEYEAGRKKAEKSKKELLKFNNIDQSTQESYSKIEDLNALANPSSTPHIQKDSNDKLTYSTQPTKNIIETFEQYKKFKKETNDKYEKLNELNSVIDKYSKPFEYKPKVDIKPNLVDYDTQIANLDSRINKADSKTLPQLQAILQAAEQKGKIKKASDIDRFVAPNVNELNNQLIAAYEKNKNKNMYATIGGDGKVTSNANQITNMKKANAAFEQAYNTTQNTLVSKNIQKDKDIYRQEVYDSLIGSGVDEVTANRVADDKAKSMPDYSKVQKDLNDTIAKANKAKLTKYKTELSKAKKSSSATNGKSTKSKFKRASDVLKSLAKNKITERADPDDLSTAVNAGTKLVNNSKGNITWDDINDAIIMSYKQPGVDFKVFSSDGDVVKTKEKLLEVIRKIKSPKAPTYINRIEEPQLRDPVNYSEKINKLSRANSTKLQNVLNSITATKSKK